jgi:hypothetical protein
MFGAMHRPGRQHAARDLRNSPPRSVTRKITRKVLSRNKLDGESEINHSVLRAIGAPS